MADTDWISWHRPETAAGSMTDEQKLTARLAVTLMVHERFTSDAAVSIASRIVKMAQDAFPAPAEPEPQEPSPEPSPEKQGT